MPEMMKQLTILVIFSIAMIGMAGAVVNLSGLNESERMDLKSGNIGLDTASNSLTTSQTAFLESNPEIGKPYGNKSTLRLGSNGGYDPAAQYEAQEFLTPSEMLPMPWKISNGPETSQKVVN